MKLFHSLLVAAVVAQTTVEPITGGLDPRGRGGKKKAGFKSDKYVSFQIQIKKNDSSLYDSTHQSHFACFDASKAFNFHLFFETLNIVI